MRKRLRIQVSQPLPNHRQHFGLALGKRNATLAPQASPLAARQRFSCREYNPRQIESVGGAADAALLDGALPIR